MGKVINFDEHQYIRLMLYGEGGSGKTRTSGTASLHERTAPALMLEIGGNPISIKNYNPRPYIYRLDKIVDLNLPYDFIAKGQPKDHAFRDKLGIDSDVIFKTLIIDGMTDLQRLVMNKIGGRENLSLGDTPAKLTFNHYGNIHNQMLNITTKLCLLPIHLVMTALEDDRLTEDIQRARAAPLFIGQTSRDLPAKAEIVARVQIKQAVSRSVAKQLVDDPNWEEAIHIVWFAASSKYYAKDQASNRKLGKYLLDPTIADIVSIIFD